MRCWMTGKALQGGLSGRTHSFAIPSSPPLPLPLQQPTTTSSTATSTTPPLIAPHPPSSLSLDELDELEDELDDRTLQHYRSQHSHPPSPPLFPLQCLLPLLTWSLSAVAVLCCAVVLPPSPSPSVSSRRLAELSSASRRPSFGSLKEVRGSDFVSEVTTASTVVPVVVHLYHPQQRSCRTVSRHLQTLAQRFPHTKFLEILAVEAIPNYPPHRTPTLLVYVSGDMTAQIVGIDSVGGLEGCSAEKIEWRLKEAKAIEGSRLTLDPFTQSGTGAQRMKIHNTAKGGGIRRGGGYEDNDDNEGDDDED